MGIYDRDYMRRGKKTPVAEVREQLSSNPRWQLFAALAAVGLVIAVLAWPSKKQERDAEVDYGDTAPYYHGPLDPVDINEAPLEAILRIPGVDAEIAQGILEQRPFGKPEDLLDVRGIGKANLPIIRQYIYVDDD